MPFESIELNNVSPSKIESLRGYRVQINVQDELIIGYLYNVDPISKNVILYYVDEEHLQSKKIHFKVVMSKAISLFEIESGGEPSYLDQVVGLLEDPSTFN